MKKLNCVMTAFIVFILQAAILPFMFNSVSQPNLIFVFVVLMALHHGQRIGIITALLGGFLSGCHYRQFLWPAPAGLSHRSPHLQLPRPRHRQGPVGIDIAHRPRGDRSRPGPDLRVPLPGRPVHQHRRLLVGIQHPYACLSRNPGPAGGSHRLASAPRRCLLRVPGLSLVNKGDLVTCLKRY